MSDEQEQIDILKELIGEVRVLNQRVQALEAENTSLREQLLEAQQSFLSVRIQLEEAEAQAEAQAEVQAELQESNGADSIARRQTRGSSFMSSNLVLGKDVVR